MRILYGVSGDGYGHSSRAIVIAEFLQKQGHEVKILTYGQAYKVLKNKFDIFKVSGMTLIFNRGVLNKTKTLQHNYEHFSKNILCVKKFHNLMREFKPDVCISDFEPIVPILSYWYKCPLISIDNQHRITNFQIDVPKKYMQDYLISKAVVNGFVARANHFIVTSFANLKILKKNTTCVSPIIREEVKKLKPVYGNKILVYLTRKNDNVINVLKNMKEDFVVYGYNKCKIVGNLEFKTKETFSKDLENCKAIIASSGFTLMSEAIYIRKPYYAIPLAGQFEQVLNSLFLKQAGFGYYSEEITEKDIVYFLYKLETYKKNLKGYKFNFNKLFEVIKKELKKIDKNKV